ncbi:hypothetical protein BaRGS_00038269 [Batillaria attramentaria]|uniref:Uncharacterized protein n=1 Tax=Batillaria attramentaria TaxID=370345 RepID=A0ABD0J6B4_9CAEN
MRKAAKGAIVNSFIMSGIRHALNIILMNMNHLKEADENVRLQSIQSGLDSVSTDTSPDIFLLLQGTVSPSGDKLLQDRLGRCFHWPKEKLELLDMRVFPLAETKPKKDGEISFPESYSALLYRLTVGLSQTAEKANGTENGKTATVVGIA